MNMNVDELKLKRVLEDWRVAPVANRAFRTGVWARIERGRGVAGWVSFVRGHAVVCAVVLGLALGAGAWTGRERARVGVELERAAMLTSFVSALDARSMKMP